MIDIPHTHTQRLLILLCLPLVMVLCMCATSLQYNPLQIIFKRTGESNFHLVLCSKHCCNPRGSKHCCNPRGQLDIMLTLASPSPCTAAAKSLQSCPTLCDPIDGSPPSSAIPGILQARALEWVAISFSNAWKWKVKVKSLSRVRLLATPWTAAYQAPPSMGFPRQEFWSGLPLPSPIILHSACQIVGAEISVYWMN